MEWIAKLTEHYEQLRSRPATAIRGTDNWQYRLFLVKELVTDHPASRRLSEALIEKLGSNRKLTAATAKEISTGRMPGGMEIGDSAGYLFGKQAVGSPLVPSPSST